MEMLETRFLVEISQLKKAGKLSPNFKLAKALSEYNKTVFLDKDVREVLPAEVLKVIDEKIENVLKKYKMI